MRLVFRTAWGPRSAWLGRLLSRAARVEPTALRWAKLAGPHFGNAVGTLRLVDRQAQVTIDATDPDARLVNIADLQLTG